MKIVFPMTRKGSMVNAVGSLVTWIDAGMTRDRRLCSVCDAAAGCTAYGRRCKSVTMPLTRSARADLQMLPTPGLYAVTNDESRMWESHLEQRGIVVQECYARCGIPPKDGDVELTSDLSMPVQFQVVLH